MYKLRLRRKKRIVGKRISSYSLYITIYNMLLIFHPAGIHFKLELRNHDFWIQHHGFSLGANFWLSRNNVVPSLLAFSHWIKWKKDVRCRHFFPFYPVRTFFDMNKMKMLSVGTRILDNFHEPVKMARNKRTSACFPPSKVLERSWKNDSFVTDLNSFE